MNNKKRFEIINFLLAVYCLLLLNVISWHYFFRVDLTEEKRYTITQASKNTLQSVDDVIFIEIYLEGDLPAGFKRLQRSIKETLDEFRIYSGGNIQYKFTDPLAESDEKMKSRFMYSLAQKGVQPTNLFVNENGKQTEKIIFPGAILNYKGREVPLLFLKGASGASPSEALNQSVEGIEFELISAIKKLTSIRKKRIAILQGHDEADGIATDEVYQTLKEGYLVDKLNLSQVNDIKSYFDILLIIAPKKPFTDAEKLKIDQFVMKGGKILAFIEKADVNQEKLGTDESLAGIYDLNIDDLLFRYGIRVNNDLILDLQSGAIPMVTGMLGDKPQTRLMPWVFHPMITQFGSHTTVKNMGTVYTKYISSIDTVKALGINKIPLAYSSNYNKVATLPANISLEKARKQPDPAEYNSKPNITGVLLEGNFRSLFANRLSKEKADSIGFIENGTKSQIIVFSDADMVYNESTPDKKQLFPMGFDKYMGKKFANKELFSNCITFLADENGIMYARLKEVKLRPLDKIKVKEERTKWQLINVAVPVFLIILIGFVKYNIRKSRYAN